MLRIALVSSLIVLVAASPHARPHRAHPHRHAAAGPATAVTYVAGSTREVCRLTGEPETATATRFGYRDGDLGYSFLYGGRLWFLFGDSFPTATFKGADNKSNRFPFNTNAADPNAHDNDAVAYAPRGGPATQCPPLTFVAQTPAPKGVHPAPAPGAYANPELVLGGTQIPLGTNQAPVAGFATGSPGHETMYVAFVTNNANGRPPPECKSLRQPPGICYGRAYSSVLARLNDRGNPPRSLAFTGVYTLSGPPQGDGSYAGAFVNVAFADGPGGYVYVWGTYGGGERIVNGHVQCAVGAECQMHSYVRLARIPLARVAAAASGRSAAIEYYDAANHAQPWQKDEHAATPLFRDATPCGSHVGVQWIPALARWVLLYNCPSAKPSGIVMRSAPQPWGPWSAPQTIFNPARDHGYCAFMHLDHAPASCKPNPGRAGTSGTPYGPYFIAGWTTAASHPSGATAVVYYTVSTLNPHGQVILASTLTRGSAGIFRTPPPCRGSMPDNPCT